VTGDTILQQTETACGDASNVIQTTNRQRYHNAAATESGALNGPGGPAPKAKVTYTAHWQDALGREIATANYGTNGGSALSRPSTVPARSDTVLVTSTEYNARGEPFKTIDPLGREDRIEFDAAARRTKLIENYVDGNPATGDPDEDRTTQWTYTPDGAQKTLLRSALQTGRPPSTRWNDL
jgi:hypothetical protein